MLVLYKSDIIIISLNVTCYGHDIANKLFIWHSTTITHSLIFNSSIELMIDNNQKFNFRKMCSVERQILVPTLVHQNELKKIDNSQLFKTEFNEKFIARSYLYCGKISTTESSDMIRVN